MTDIQFDLIQFSINVEEKSRQTILLTLVKSVRMKLIPLLEFN